MDAALSVYDGADAIVVVAVGDGHGLREGHRVSVAPDGTSVARLLDSARHARGPSGTMLADSTTIATGVTDPSGAIVAAVSLAGRRDERAWAKAPAVLLEAMPRIRFSIYQDELFG